jgi:hypothetical protein
MSGKNHRSKEFWLEKLKSGFAEQEVLYVRKQELVQRINRQNRPRVWFSDELIVHFNYRFSSETDRARLIKINQKLKQLRTTKLPYYWQQLQRKK